MSTESIRLIMQQYGVDFRAAVKIYEGIAPTEKEETEPLTISQTVSRAFWAWAQTKYSPEEIEIIGENPNKYLQFYQRNIQGTQWDVGFQPDVTRPPEEFGLTDVDWRGLTGLMRDEAGLQGRLQEWIDEGRIDRSQAADIWNELGGQRMRESRAVAAGQRRVDFMRFATGQVEFPEDRARRLLREKEAERVALRDKRRRVGVAPSPRKIAPQPFTEFGTAEEFITGFDIPQTEPAIAWFNRRFPRLIEQFRAEVPEEEQKVETWAELLARRRPEIREEFSRLSFFQRGLRPSAFAPRVTTVRF